MPFRPLIVLVEDHDELRRATRDMLDGAGFNVIDLSCAEELDDTPLPRAPDVYVIDINLPGEDGLALTRRLRKAQPGCVIIMTTARSSLEDRLQGYDSGATIYLPKPVEPAELVATIRSTCRLGVIEQSSMGKLTVDMRRSVLVGPAGESKLTQAELRLISAFARAQEQSLERWQVAAQLESGADGISADSLQNRISQLRRRLTSCGLDGGALKAIRGEGYCLSIPCKLVQ